eukprot:363966-Chlamydomonas_euryale.AAC.9
MACCQNLLVWDGQPACTCTLAGVTRSPTFRRRDDVQIPAVSPRGAAPRSAAVVATATAASLKPCARKASLTDAVAASDAAPRYPLGSRPTAAAAAAAVSARSRGSGRGRTAVRKGSGAVGCDGARRERQVALAARQPQLGARSKRAWAWPTALPPSPSSTAAIVPASRPVGSQALNKEVWVWRCLCRAAPRLADRPPPPPPPVPDAGRTRSSSIRRHPRKVFAAARARTVANCSIGGQRGRGRWRNHGRGRSSFTTLN